MKSAILIICDGFGIAPPGPGNAVSLAKPPTINMFFQSFPNTTLIASGDAVGLPAQEVGNTEVGHLNIGAGRIVNQDLPRINMSIADGSFYSNASLLKAVEHLAKTGGAFHIIGLTGQGAVHSSIDHLYALLHFCKEQKIQKVFIHAITDGRDSPPKSGSETMRQLEEKLKQMGIGRIASVSGRYYAMDRDRRWERIEKSYSCLTKAIGQKATSAVEAVTQSYQSGKTDEFVEPTNIVENGIPIALIKEGDAVIFFNYRIDRPRELTKAFVLEDFENQANQSGSFDPYAIKYDKTHLAKPTSYNPPFKRGDKIKNLYFITMTEYEKNLAVDIAYPQYIVRMPIGRVISEFGLAQLRISESEKEKFVTFYLNGQRDLAFPLEERQIIPSPKVPTYDLKPEMSAVEVTDNVIKKMQTRKYTFIAMNFANCDMVGHTGNLSASMRAVLTVDQCLKRIFDTAMECDYGMFITADHGNVEQKINPRTGGISTEHTSNPVPFICISKEYRGNFARLQQGILADVAPTILSYMEIPKPEDMTGRNLLEEIV
ncbi:MAG: 2,3-bisphosphoglycerate-independent phosphoglycerate mutase [Candidatus Roizmanbacteria bacterium]